MDLQLSSKTALVTGSTAGIGLAIARALAAEGANVVINGRTEQRVREALAKLRSELPAATVTGVVADLGDAAGCGELCSRVADVDILVNNLGIYGSKPFEEISDDNFHHIIEVNFMSGLRLARHYLPRMKVKNWGRILFISSESAIDVPSEMIHYGVTKTMQLALSRGLAKLCAGTAVTVNSVLAGPTFSEGVEQFIGGLARERKSDAKTIEGEFFSGVRPNSLIRRFASVDEIASLCAYLASPLAGATTGAALRADGGIINGLV
jgi:NAD(P)-dependent dehydrogenase (short-subunit alcohol dehydrogenase family)